MSNAQPVPSPTTNSTHNTAQLQGLFQRNYSHVKQEASAPGLYVSDIDNIITATASRLADYTGPLEDGAFCEWVTAHVRPAAERLSRYYQMRTDHRKIVLKAVWSVVKDCSSLGADFGDLSMGIESPTVRKIAHTIWIKVFLDLDRWLAPGYSKNPSRPPAKLSTRLYDFARPQAMGWRTDRIRRRKKYMSLDTYGKREEAWADREPGKLPPRPIVLGPGDDGAFEQPAHSGVSDLKPWDIPLDDSDMTDAEGLEIAA